MRRLVELPIVEIAADIDVFRPVAFQDEVNVAALLVCSTRFRFHFVFLAPLFSSILA